MEPLAWKIENYLKTNLSKESMPIQFSPRLQSMFSGMWRCCRISFPLWVVCSTLGLTWAWMVGSVVGPVHPMVIAIVIKVSLGLELKSNVISSKKDALFLGKKIIKSKVTSHQRSKTLFQNICWMIFPLMVTCTRFEHKVHWWNKNVLSIHHIFI